jgi:hypothetical protein
MKDSFRALLIHRLPHTLICLTDPTPKPVAMASDLLAQGIRAILIVDNCGQELHRQLSEVCKASESHLSLLTIEFYIQDDLPEKTDVFDER